MTVTPSVGKTTPDGYAKYCDAREAFDRGDVESAERLLVESVELGAHFKTHELLGDIFASRNEDHDALNQYASACRLNPHSDSAATKHARVLTASGRHDDARAIIKSVLARNPSYGPARQLVDELHC